MNTFANKRVTILGLGRFGGNIAAARWLAEQGAKVLVSDQDDAASLADSVKQLEGLPIEFRLGKLEQRMSDFVDTDLVVTSPAVKPSNAFLSAARDAGVTVTTEICLFVERCRGKVFGITGTKGKSTTTAMLGLILKHAMGDKRCFVGGNIGKSLLFDLPDITDDSCVVLELSSYMLHYLGDAGWSPDVAVVTMLGIDHIDWHGSVDAYHAAKRNIVRNQKPGGLLVRRDDVLSSNFLTNPGVKLLTYPDPTRPTIDLILPGDHNRDNAQAAWLASGVDIDIARQALGNFTGLPHRLQLVAERDGVRFFNDSNATIPESAVIACDAFSPGTVIQIVGGFRKPGISWDAMCAHLSARCKHVICIGEFAADLCAMCDNAETAPTLDAAVARAKQIATPGDVILLSPGTSSFGEFVNFQERGERFTTLAQQTP